MGEVIKVALLSLHSFDEVRGGTELFSEHLKNVFPDLTHITYSMAKGGDLLPRLDRLNLQEARMGVAISRKFKRMLREEDFDLVICNSIAGWWLSVRQPPVPMVNVYHYTLIGLAEQTLRGTSGYLPSRYLGPAFERTAARSKCCVAVSHKVRRELAERYGITARVIENGISLDTFRPIDKEEAREELDLPLDRPIALFVGRADHTKGFDIAEAVARERKDLQIVCVTPSQIECRDMILRRNVPNERMPLFYSAADLLLMPSRYESFGYTALEAMACDLPVVASRTGIFEDLKDPRAGKVVDTPSLGEYLVAINDVLSTDLHPRQLAGEKFSMERFADSYHQLAKDVMDGSGPPASG